MTFPDITSDLKTAMPQLRGRLLANQSLAELTWFRVGGPAQVLFTPSDEDDLAYFLKALPDELPVYVVGVGSNLIVRDGGMPGVVIRLSPRAFGEIGVDGDVVSAGTAALDKRVAETAAAAVSATRLSSAADPALTMSPPAEVSPKPRGDNRITTPGMPPSRTIKLEPTPTT